jgi:hypothetical protein
VPLQKSKSVSFVGCFLTFKLLLTAECGSNTLNYQVKERTVGGADESAPEAKNSKSRKLFRQRGRTDDASPVWSKKLICAGGSR